MIYIAQDSSLLEPILMVFGASILATIIENQLSSHATSNILLIATAFNTAFWWAIGFAVLAFIPALLLSKHKSEAATE